MPRITNAVLLEKIENLKEYLVERNNTQDKKIELQEQEIKKNTIAIAGIKGIAVGISVFITTAINGVVAYFTMRGQG